jgi:ribonuclease Y
MSAAPSTIAGKPDILTLISQTVPVWIAVAFFFAAGIALGIIAYRMYYAFVRLGAENEAEEIRQTVQDQVELRQLEEKERLQEIEVELWTKEEAGLLKLEEHIEELEELTTEKKQKSDDRYSQARQKSTVHEQEVKAGEAQVKKAEEALTAARAKLRELNESFITKLSTRTGQTREEAKLELMEALFRETTRTSQERAEQTEADMKEHAETHAKEMLALVLGRFARAACPERGIAPVYYADENAKKGFLSLGDAVYKAVQEACGCDIIVDASMDMVGVAGFDPVRRELTRRVLERILKEKKSVSPDWVYKVAGNIKTEILRMIKHDGDALAKELKLEGLHPEVRQMMGSLRYRYSFTQNQHFHCAEVGWLCGLLAAEMRTVDSKKARRSGLLHDLGKAMDHELDGGHAVIGADFIQKRGEAPDIVHAVKAHHYDETPATDMAYLVIAADAISGARPGARRSTIESYNQKVTELQDIARSFDGVTDCFILSGGRECRVMVNGRRVDDMQALRMSGDIAKRIETECSYPGQIKVVVVRETLVFEQAARMHA